MNWRGLMRDMRMATSRDALAAYPMLNLSYPNTPDGCAFISDAAGADALGYRPSPAQGLYQCQKV